MSPLSVGQPCFAKVKGFPAWPAKITAIQGNNRYEVFFFGTAEIATLADNSVWEASPANMAKFITQKVKKRKFYAIGVEEMNKLIKKNPTYSTKADHSYSSPTKSKQATSKKAPLVLVDTRTAPKSPVKNAPIPKSPVKSIQNTKSPVKAVPSPKSPVKSAPVPKSPVKSASVPKSPVKSVKSSTVPKTPILEIATPTEKESSRLSRRTLTPAKKKSPRASPKAIASEAISEKPTRRGEKRTVEENKESLQTKKKKIGEPERIKVNIQLEMSEEAFLRVSKELPGILALTGHPIDLNMQVQKK